ncbi:hypothetical protein V8C86DRAFT_2599960, partial [Haematococcus lacustris]
MSLVASHSCAHLLLQPVSRPPLTLPGRRFAVSQASLRSKGFGNVDSKQNTVDDNELDAPAKRRRARRQSQPSLQPSEQAQPVFQSNAAATKPGQDEEDTEFSQRLEALKAQAKALRATSGIQAAGAQNVAAFDADVPGTNIYANPPSLSDTLLTQLNSDVSDPALKNAQFGPNQLSVAAGAVVFGLVFVLVAGGDFLPNNRFKGVRPTQLAPDTVEEGLIRGRMAALQQTLDQSPNDPTAIQGLALSYAQLLQYDKAAELLDKLVAQQPSSADAWRLLGETTLLGEQAKRAVSAFERADSLRPDDLQIATGLVDAYIGNGQQAKAVSYLLGLRQRAPPLSSLGVLAVEAREQASSPLSSSPAAGTAGPGLSPGDLGAAGTPVPATLPEPAAGPDTSDPDTVPASPQPAPPPTSGNSVLAAAGAGQPSGSGTGQAGAGGEAEQAPDALAATALQASLPSQLQAGPPPQPQAATTSSGGLGSSSGSSTGSAAIRPLEPVSVELLLAKTYSQWRGHESDALATYDAVIARFPEDFRGYLAKGVLLRDKGRRADADRMFIQARFWAPENRQRFVKEASETKPVVDLPSN